MATKTDQKIAILRQILSSKDVLFGAFSEILTKEIKVAEWKKIGQSCQSMGLIKSEEGYAYVRDTFWSNMKRATLAKKDNARKTGAAGGKNQQLTPIDDLVLEILGQNSPIVEGIGVLDSMETASKKEDVLMEILLETPKKQNLDMPKSEPSKRSRKGVKFITKGSKHTPISKKIKS